jgi:hypothetical protein
VTEFIGTSFSDLILWGQNEIATVDSIRQQVESTFVNQENLIINMTWFGPQFPNHSWQQYLELNQSFDNLFLIATVDPPMITTEQIDQIVKQLGHPTLYKLGNFDTKYRFDFFAPILARHFKNYSDEQTKLKSIRWLYCNYNRKPRRHRVDFVRKLIESNLDQVGIITLGKPNTIYDQDPDNTLYFSIGEKIDDYRSTGHWYSDDEFGIPHDVLSLHNLDVWQNHFLHIISATEFFPWDDIFVSETQWKPVIGRRPFLINGNTRTYKWLRDNGFQTFNHYFPGVEFENVTETQVHDTLISAIQYLTTLTADNIMELYHSMCPALEHNYNRFYEYAQEQYNRKDNLFL